MFLTVLWGQVDDGDGKLDFEEFVAVLSSSHFNFKTSSDKLTSLKELAQEEQNVIATAFPDVSKVHIWMTLSHYVTVFAPFAFTARWQENEKSDRTVHQL